MAFTQAQRDALQEKIASATRRVTYQDKTVENEPLAEMRALLDEMDRQLAGTSATPRMTRLAHSRD